jgi:hypothetical protein
MLNHRPLRPLASTLAIHIQHQVIVIGHHCISADLYREDLRELSESLDHPLFAMQVVLPGVLIESV